MMIALKSSLNNHVNGIFLLLKRQHAAVMKFLTVVNCTVVLVMLCPWIRDKENHAQK